MKRPDRPQNEDARLAALSSYRILDTAPEPDFDGLAALAAQILDVPIALISLVDAERQWFKAHHGLAATQTPRDVSFCGHVVASEQMLVVPDALEDERFADNPLVTGDPRVRFYAGMPLRMSDGYVLGTLCAIDHQPRTLTPEQEEQMAILSRQVIAQLALRRRNFQLEAQDRLQRQLVREKEILLQELQHRVKNNLQLMTSMLNMQQRAVGDGPGSDTLESCQGRIQAIAVVHDALYGVRNFASVSLSQYARQLTSAIMEVVLQGANQIELELDVDDVELNVTQAVPCGLILNELVTNALKHAFPDGRGGTIRIGAHLQSGSYLRLQVTDDGVGLDPDFKLDTDSTVGMQLISALADQLGATFEVGSDAGSRFTLIFPVEHEIATALHA